ncbi:hypothetical protein GLP21_12365 [Photobacterium carnosum]|uniref:Uncharacterized protein n=1 Tax=Photobacterium carnosum TaxID=2023717 RepID=A0A2N4UW64_9GAMM|nr:MULTISPECIES: hypothetical protein [Photobacterium]MCD9475860.1 hypothetical protein [Photobacterium phosphoreum]MCD9485911.1 hypothetical protein [Photobacterium iliopiscarium]MCD9507722.1 hypothetical protein [Photobacterium phosphoreum]MCD9538157.1 hypothetical protein [Photobacterium carnosum]MCD9542556.1 hypothetical protein [Photobacterium carnosum]
MNNNNKVKPDIIKAVMDYRYSQGEKFERYFQTTKNRFQVCTSRSRKREIIEINSTIERLKQRIERYSDIVSILYNHEQQIKVSNVNYMSIGVVNNEFTLFNQSLFLRFNCAPPETQLTFLVTPQTISTHAVVRYLERNNTLDVKAAIVELGMALVDCAQELASHCAQTGLCPTGHTERNIKTINDGIAIIIIPDPSVLDYSEADWKVVTYISPDMVKDFNLRSHEAGFVLDDYAIEYKDDIRSYIDNMLS